MRVEDLRIRVQGANLGARGRARLDAVGPVTRKAYVKQPLKASVQQPLKAYVKSPLKAYVEQPLILRQTDTSKVDSLLESDFQILFVWHSRHSWSCWEWST